MQTLCFYHRIEQNKKNEHEISEFVNYESMTQVNANVLFLDIKFLIEL